MHFMDANSMYEENTLQQLHKNAVNCIEQILEATHHKTAVTVTYHLSGKLSKLDDPDMRDTAGEVRTNL